MLEVVDPHVHLWDLWTRLYPHFERPKKGGMNAAICRSYLLDEFLDEGKGQISIIGAVHVEAFPTDPVKETATLQNVADASPIPIVMVAGGDLSSPDFVQMLDEHAAFPILRGVRQVLNRHADTRFNYVDRNIMDDPHFVVGLHVLGTRGLTFDLQLYPHQMEQAAGLAARCPQTSIVLNHAGMWTDRHLTGWRAWKTGLRVLAAQPNISVKISGLGMRDRDWTTESIRPLVLETIEAFGAHRAMFASNFPVDKLTSTYLGLWRAFDLITTEFTEPERANLFRVNATRIYRVH